MRAAHISPARELRKAARLLAVEQFISQLEGGLVRSRKDFFMLARDNGVGPVDRKVIWQFFKRDGSGGVVPYIQSLKVGVDSVFYNAAKAVINETEAQSVPTSAPYGFDAFDYESFSGVSRAAKIDGRLCEGKTYEAMIKELLQKIEEKYHIKQYGIRALHPDCLDWPQMKQVPPAEEIVQIPDVIDSRNRWRDRTIEREGKKIESQSIHLDKNGLEWPNDDAALVVMHLSYRLKNGFPLLSDGKTIDVDAIGTERDKGDLFGGQIVRTRSRSLSCFLPGVLGYDWDAHDYPHVSAAGAPKSQSA